MRLVVTGRTGQLVRSLEILDGSSGSTANSTVEVISIGRPTLDLARPGSVFPALRNADPDVIVSAAAYTDVDGAEGDAQSVFLINAHGAKTMAQSAAVLGVPIIHISTDYVFGGDLRRPYCEDDLTTPRTQYGLSKLAGEKAILAAYDNSVILRTAWLMSPFGSNFAKAILTKAAQQEQISVVSDQSSNPTFACDLADAIIRIAERLIAAPDRSDLRGIFHLCGGRSMSRAIFAEEIMQSSARYGGPVVPIKTIATLASAGLAPRPANSQMNCQKIADRYGISLPGWSKSLDQTVRAFCQPTIPPPITRSFAKTQLSAEL